MQDNSQVVETLPLARIKRVREWQEGFEELEAIPHSFALELKGEREPRGMFTDGADDKVRIKRPSMFSHADALYLCRRICSRF